jgi:hypothetical protein
VDARKATEATAGVVLHYVEDGRPSLTPQVRAYPPLQPMAGEKTGLEHCGLCADFPCETFLVLRDPSLSDEEFERSLEKRKSALRRRAEIGTENWLQEVSRA